MSFPRDMNHLKAHGYKFQDDSVCKFCGADIEWWETPSGKKLPFDPMTYGASAAVMHITVCSGQ
jgi:hypothetical protein